MWAALILSEASLLGLETAVFPCCVLTWSPLCAEVPPVSLPICTGTRMGLGHTLRTSFKLDHVLQVLMSKYSDILRCWVLGLQGMNFEGLHST